jgi:hypothetical protein
MQAVETDCGQRPDKRLRGTLEIHFVEEFFCGCFAWVAGLQFKCANAGIDGFCLREHWSYEQSYCGCSEQELLRCHWFPPDVSD